MTAMPDDDDDITEEQLERIAEEIAAQSPMTDEELMAEIERLNEESEKESRPRDDKSS